MNEPTNLTDTLDLHARPALQTDAHDRHERPTRMTDTNDRHERPTNMLLKGYISRPLGTPMLHKKLSSNSLPKLSIPKGVKLSPFRNDIHVDGPMGHLLLDIRML